MKSFLSKLGEKYSLHKNPETQHTSETSSEESVNEVVQAVMTHKNYLPNQVSLCHATGEDDLMELFDQFAR